MIEKSKRWDIGFIRKFMFTFGIVSSAFDFLTFGLLLLVLHVSQDTFRTGWFFVSVMTELAIMLVIRTQRPFFQSKPGKGLLYSTIGVASSDTGFVIYPSAEHAFGIYPLPWSLMLALIGIAVMYVLVNEVVKRIFYQRVHF